MYVCMCVCVCGVCERVFACKRNLQLQKSPAKQRKRPLHIGVLSRESTRHDCVISSILLYKM
jgi:hypothetical protein